VSDIKKLYKRMEKKIHDLNTHTDEEQMVGTNKWYCDQIKEWQETADLWKDIADFWKDSADHYISEIEKLVVDKQELQKKILNLMIELADLKRPKVREI